MVRYGTKRLEIKCDKNAYDFKNHRYLLSDRHIVIEQQCNHCAPDSLMSFCAKETFMVARLVPW